MQIRQFVPQVIAAALCLLLTACAGEPSAPDLNVVHVTSSKPYRYIRYSKTDDPETIKEIRHHNYTHAMIKKAEAAAEAKAKDGKIR
jgi:hypothetical protein